MRLFLRVLILLSSAIVPGHAVYAAVAEHADRGNFPHRVQDPDGRLDHDSLDWDSNGTAWIPSTRMQEFIDNEKVRVQQEHASFVEGQIKHHDPGKLKHPRYDSFLELQTYDCWCGI